LKPADTHGTVLALDLGLKRTGVASGELSIGIAHPLTVIQAGSTDTRLTAIANLIAEWSPVLLVLGLPTHADGSEHEMTRVARNFANKLESRFNLPVFLVDENGQHPAPHTLVTQQDIQSGRWKFNPQVAKSLGVSSEAGQQHLLHYTRTLKQQGKYDLTIWPYHAMLGGIGHALVPAVEEAIFFHTLARGSQAEFEIKGQIAMTENYSAIGPDVLAKSDGEPLGEKTLRLMQTVVEYDAMIIAGQAKSHCVAWTIGDLLEQIQAEDARLARKVYLLEDCTSPVVVPGVMDYSPQADQAFQRFAQAGMHLVRSSRPLAEWIEITKLD